MFDHPSEISALTPEQTRARFMQIAAEDNADPGIARTVADASAPVRPPVPVYVALARAVGSYHRCGAPGANESQREWRQRHADRITALVRRYLPSGSGFNDGTVLDIDTSTEERLEFYTGFHHMNEHGFYDGWTRHNVTVRGSLSFGLRIAISGRDHNDVKELIHEEFHAALTEEIDEHADL